MQGFQETSVLSPASEAIATTFEKFLQLAGGLNTNPNPNPQEGSRAQEVLYVSDSLKDTLPLMSLKFSTKILYYFKYLLALHQPVATRRITDALYLLCLQPTVDVSPEALGDLLCSLATSPLSVATEALKSLIHTCVDGSLIKQGVDQIMASGSVRKSAPTIIEKLCATVESLLDYRFAAVWDMSFQVVAAMFDKLGEFSSCFLKGTLKSLEGIQKLPDDDFLYRKQNIVGARLSFFNESLLENIKVLKLKSTRNLDWLVYSLWSLLPSFCNYPVDTAESFNDLEKELCRSLREESDFRGVICSSLQILVQQNKRIMGAENEPSGKVSISQQRAVSLYTPEVAARNLDVLRSSVREILSTLSRVFMKSTKDDGGSLQRTIGEFAYIADKSVVSKLYKSTMQKLVKVTQEAGKINNSSNETSPSLTRAKLYDLAVALLPGFGTTEVDHLFDAVEPALRDTESLIQKKAYKILSTILEHDDSFIARKFEELLKLMFEVMHSCHFSAKRHRLDCLYFLIAHVSKSNKKTRNRAYEIIVEIGHACVDEDKGGNKENLYNFFNMVAGGLAGESPHMISAAVKGMARLTYEFNDLLSNAFDVLPSTFLLLRRKNREINKVRIF
ncbi:putative armadillo-like helical protein [Helianthus debilis subsp. tardiflorus]